MGFSGKVTNAVDSIFIKYPGHLAGIAYVRFDKNIPFGKIFFNIGQILRISGIGQVVDIHDPSGKIGFLEQVPDETCSDKPAPACNQQVLHKLTRPFQFLSEKQYHRGEFFAK